MMIIAYKRKGKSKGFRGKFLEFIPVLYRQSGVKIVLTSRFAYNVSWEDTG